MHHLEFSYQPKGLLGKPDFADRKRKIAVFIDGCFWHGCPRHGHYPKSNAQFWKNKILTNKKRDKRFNLKLKENGWRVIRVWEHELR
jgi:DNA mismatch endonuclease (patch repair protein)